MELMEKEQVISELKTKLGAATDHFKQEAGKIRTGRAHPGMLDNVMVEAYGQKMPLKAVGSITVPEPQQLQITPFDPGNLQAVSEAISNDKSLGLNPADDGRVVRIQIPPLTEESRQQMVKILHQKLEESLIASRNARHEGLRKAEAAEKAKEIGRDELSRLEKQIDELLAKQKTEVDSVAAAKEKEITTI
jgi:ribosome recycling factor